MSTWCPKLWRYKPRIRLVGWSNEDGAKLFWALVRWTSLSGTCKSEWTEGMLITKSSWDVMRWENGRSKSPHELSYWAYELCMPSRRWSRIASNAEDAIQLSDNVGFSNYGPKPEPEEKIWSSNRVSPDLIGWSKGECQYPDWPCENWTYYWTQSMRAWRSQVSLRREDWERERFTK